MAATERLYRRTDAGQSAYENPNSGLGGLHRSILNLVETDTHSELIRVNLRRYYPEKQIFECLDQRQCIGFLESELATAKHDLDFTGSFNIADLRTRQKAA